jgi:hypothetical protein
MDVSDASYYIQENNKNKGSRMGHTKKIFKKKNELETLMPSSLPLLIILYHFVPL